MAWYDYGISSDSDGGYSTYNNTNVGTPVDTPLSFPLGGTITTLGYPAWGGQITWKVDNPAVIGGHQYAFMIHLDAINPALQVGQTVTAGTFAGYSGGQLDNSGLPALPAGYIHHTTSPQHSTGPHLDIGVTDSPDGSLTVSKQYGDALVLYARSNKIPVDASVPSSAFTLNLNDIPQAIHDTLNNVPGFLAIVYVLDIVEAFQPLKPNDPNPITNIANFIGFLVVNITAALVRGLIMFIGLFILIALIKNALTRVTTSTTGQGPGELASSALKLGSTLM